MNPCSAPFLFLCVALLAVGHLRGASALVEEDYNQWKQALNTNAATAATNLTVAPGFKVDLLRSAQPGEGSWVALTFDPQGRIILAREDRGLLRFNPASSTASAAQLEIINTNLLECRGLLFAHGALYANANNSKALVRLRDLDGDEQFEEVAVLRHTPGGVGHGRNQLALGPDGFIYSIHGDDVRLPTNGVAATSPFRHYADDRLLPCAWDRHLFDADASMPFGHVIRTDRDGKTWELVAGGLRNPFGLDFNASGDLFTFDADMEWDVGLSWYHPTRVLHLVPGGDYGWRRGTGVLPVWSPDTLPSAVDIGAGSPTAIKFGSRSHWPEPWRSALFIEDWAYGRILAVHLTKTGASYRGRSELFIKGRPLNVTGLDFGPDGAMYFVTGGRRTQSGLYRVSWTGAHTTELPTNPVELAPAKASGPKAGDLWSRLNADDHWVRYAARVELETAPVAHWQERALQETNATAALTALLALSRCGEPTLASRLIARINYWVNSGLTVDQQHLAIRALGVGFIRMGPPDNSTRQNLLSIWEPHYPSLDAQVNQALCELLVYLGSTNVVARTIPRLATAPTQEEKFHYLFTLRLVTNGWTLDSRRTYLEWLGRARREFNGANMLPTALHYIRAEFESTLASTERNALAEALAALNAPAPAAPQPTPGRAFVKAWTIADLTAPNSESSRARDPARGQRLFVEAGCAQCHRMGIQGGVIGPDLSAVGSRFDYRTLVESIVEPSKVVAEVYRNVVVTTRAGVIWEGRIVAEDERSVVIGTNPVDPDARRRVAKGEIASRRESNVSSMPEGLLNTLAREEALDLIAWLQSGAPAASSNSSPTPARSP